MSRFTSSGSKFEILLLFPIQAFLFTSMPLQREIPRHSLFPYFMIVTASRTTDVCSELFLLKHLSSLTHSRSLLGWWLDAYQKKSNLCSFYISNFVSFTHSLYFQDVISLHTYFTSPYGLSLHLSVSLSHYTLHFQSPLKILFHVRVHFNSRYPSSSLY